MTVIKYFSIALASAPDRLKTFRNIVDNKNIVDNNSNSLVYLMREFLNFFLSYKFFVTVLLVINVTYRVKNC